MAKKNTKVQNNDYLFDFNDDLNSKNNKPIEDVIENSMLKYGSHITLNRAIPNALDGLKPVQRRIFYSFFYSNITNSFEKLANVTGICMGKFHPHGDSSINEATANLLQPWKNTFPLLEGYGNWGSSSGDNCAAMRYIEVKIPKEHAELLFDNIKKDGVVPWMKNYNDKIDEPMLLPSKFPLHLINGTSGIGYSTSTNIPPYNINELTQAMIYMIDNKFWSHEHWDINEHKDNLVDIIKGPDSPMSTNIYFQEQDKYAYLLKSKYSFRMRADMDIDYDNHQITIYNYPFGLTGEAIKQELMDLSLEKRTIKRGNKTVEIDKHESEILKVANENPIMSEYTNEHEFSMIINFRKDANLDVEAVKILSKTKMDITFNVNHIVINDKNIPEEMSLYKNLRLFLYFRKQIYLNSYSYDINKLEEQIHLLDGFSKILNNKEKFFNILKNSNNPKQDIQDEFNLDEKQAIHLLESRIKNITQIELDSALNEIQSKKAERAKLENIISSDLELFNEIKNEYLKYLDSKMLKNTQRKGIISDLSSIKDISLKDIIDDVNISVILTDENNVGYISLEDFKIHNKGTKLKNSSISNSVLDIQIKKSISCMLKDKCYFISNKGRIFSLNLWEIPKDKFVNIRNYLNLSMDEEIIQIFKEDPLLKDILIVTKNKIKTFSLDCLKNTSDNLGKTSIILSDGDVVQEVIPHNKNELQNVLLVSTDGDVLKFPKDSFKELNSLRTKGRRAISKNDTILTANVLNKENQEMLILFSNKGKIKTIDPNEIKIKKIGQAPVKGFKNNEKNGFLIKSFVIDNKSKYVLKFTSKDGKISLINLDPNDLNVVSRTAASANNFLNINDNEEIVHIEIEKINIHEQNEVGE